MAHHLSTKLAALRALPLERPTDALRINNLFGNYI